MYVIWYTISAVGWARINQQTIQGALWKTHSARSKETPLDFSWRLQSSAVSTRRRPGAQNVLGSHTGFDHTYIRMCRLILMKGLPLVRSFEGFNHSERVWYLSSNLLPNLHIFLVLGWSRMEGQLLCARAFLHPLSGNQWVGVAERPPHLPTSLHTCYLKNAFCSS